MNTDTTLTVVSVERPAVSKHLHVLIGALLFALTLGLFASNWPYTLSSGNLNLIGGVSTLGAERVLAGELPYRDFWTVYAPGQFYLLALLFRLFGMHLIVEVAAAGVVSALAVWAAYWFVYALTNRLAPSLAVAAIFAAAFFNTGYYERLDAYPPAILCVFLSLCFVVQYYHTFNTRALLLAGLATGMAVLFKHDVGFYTTIAISAGLAFYPWVSSSTRVVPVRWWRAPVPYLAAALLVIVPVTLYFARVAGAELWDAIFTFRARDWQLPGPKPELNPLYFNFTGASRSETLDNLFRYIKYTVPFVLDLSGLATIVLAVRQRKPVYAASAVTLWVGYGIHFYVAHVHIITHLVTMSAYAAATGALLYTLLRSSRRTAQSWVLPALALLVVVGWFFALTARTAYNIVRKQRDPDLVTLHLPRVEGFKVQTSEAGPLQALVAYVDEQLPPDQPLYIGLTRHDMMLTNDMQLYFILNRPIAVRYHELHPAVATTVSVQQEIMTKLESSQPPILILKATFPDEVLDQVKREFQQKLPDIGAEDLDQYIRQHYQMTEEFSPYYVWQRVGDR